MVSCGTKGVEKCSWKAAVGWHLETYEKMEAILPVAQERPTGVSKEISRLPCFCMLIIIIIIIIIIVILVIVIVVIVIVIDIVVVIIDWQ